MSRAWILVVMLVASCSRASDESNARNWQKESPPRVVQIPANLKITVSVDGKERAEITAGVLAGVTPDYADAERKAWRIATLVPEAKQPKAVIEASGDKGVTVKYEAREASEPVLYLTRRGELAVAAVDPKHPFPEYHGQGSRLGRPGDAVPRVMQVSRIAVATTP